MATIFIVALTFITGFFAYSYVTNSISVGIYPITNSTSFTSVNFLELAKTYGTFAVFFTLFWVLYIILTAVTIYKMALPDA